MPNIYALIRLMIIMIVCVTIYTFCSDNHAHAFNDDNTIPHTDTSGEAHGHIAYHQGCLNAIETCEIGHAETKIEGDTLKLWFVGGGTDTGKSVRVTDKTIALNIITPQKETKVLVLEPKPNELAEEKVGDCSFFEGRAPWLAGLNEFSATGNVNFKGMIRKIVLEYPKGYDPD